MTSSTTPTRLPRVTDEEKAACRTENALVRALAILGLISVDGSAVQCPECGLTCTLKEFSIKPDGGYKHYKKGCWGGGGSGITLLMAAPLSLSFPDAVRALVGKPTSVPVVVPDQLPQLNVKAFKAVIDHEIFGAILTYGRRYNGGECVIRAQEFYGQWHISPEVVAASGAVYITNPEHLADMLVAKFGLDRLLACGVFTMNRNDEPMCLIGRKWPVIEPARDASGKVINLQFRASDAQYAKYLAHKRGELPYEGNQKFLNVRGIDPGAVGLDVVAALPAGEQVFIVEGFKDRLAGLTFGGNYVAFPGTGYRPSAAEMEVLSQYRLVLMFDGDEAGQSAVNGVETVEADGTVKVVKPGMKHWLQAKGAREVFVHPLSDDMDITDKLVARHTQAGCTCKACAQMRNRLGG